MGGKSIYSETQREEPQREWQIKGGTNLEMENRLALKVNIYLPTSFCYSLNALSFRSGIVTE